MSIKNETSVSIDEEFAKRFQSLFDTDNFSKIGERLGITHVSVQNYWYGRRLPAPDILKKIANVTNVSINWLLSEQGSKYLSNTDEIQDQEVNETAKFEKPSLINKDELIVFIRSIVHSELEEMLNFDDIDEAEERMAEDINKVEDLKRRLQKTYESDLKPKIVGVPELRKSDDPPKTQEEAEKRANTQTRKRKKK